MKILSVFILSTLMSLANVTEDHKYYVSVTKIEYAKAQQSVQIISQIFIDDLENLIRERYDGSITLDVNDESSMVDSYIERYLKEKILININGNPVMLQFIGKEYKEDIAYCYLEVTGVTAIDTFTISHKALFDLFVSQQNIVRTDINGKKKSFILTLGNSEAVLNFN